MKKNNSSKLQASIIEFIGTLENYLKNTTFSEDRSIYRQDIATASSWLVSLQKKGKEKDVIKLILSPETDKAFTDYWRQGKWGEQEAKALIILQNKVSELQGEGSIRAES